MGNCRFPLSPQGTPTRRTRARKHLPRQPARTQRNRRGCRKISVPRNSPSSSFRDSSNASSYVTPPASEDESLGDFGDSESDSDSDNGSCCGDEHKLPKDYTLPKDHIFQRARRLLLRLFRERIGPLIKSSLYADPPEDKQPACEGCKSSNWQQEPACLNEADIHSDEEHGDDGSILATLPQGHIRFACPFQASQPQQHRQCLLQHDLITPERVITHVQRHHMKPPYCPICSQTFDTITNCDNHVIVRTCQLRELIIPEGINLYQKARLRERDNPQLSNMERWNRIYATIFPCARLPPSPYLDQGHARAVSIARDYWAKNGQNEVAKFLKGQGLLNEVGKDDEIAQVALCQLVLRDILNELVEEYGGA
ncbi:hypothetical protein FALBO_9986 [Fusarium albosuccineum]|uniref:C2H2-type domain-containing protein n=1 Tax=Fusarium albosuccineum TaxID=1237068 RepID=A0A8H4L6T6_9HYPO|nr:hypothetical protein FALBO_9986 [Fusarium albosuccineum]